MKRCSKCGETKSVDEFYVQNGKPSCWCKACNNASSKASYERNKEERNRRIVTVRRAKMLGLTYDEYLALDSDPGTTCSACGCGPDDPRNGAYGNGTVYRGTKRLAVDHCHDTGVIRGFLCSACNTAIGHAHNDPALLRAMADYLDRCASQPPPWVPLSSQKVGAKRKTHCPAGHPLDGPDANVRVTIDGARVCRPCAARRLREQRARRRALQE